MMSENPYEAPQVARSEAPGGGDARDETRRLVSAIVCLVLAIGLLCVVVAFELKPVFGLSALGLFCMVAWFARGSIEMSEDPYEAPQAEVGDRRPVRVRTRWVRIVLLIMIVFVLVALLLPALEPGRSSNEGEWRRQRDAEKSMSSEIEPSR